QSPFQVREVLAAIFGMPQTELRVVVPDVGGAFGMKSQVYPEEALVLWAARKLERPVKWTASRSESLVADMHGRNQLTEAARALADWQGFARRRAEGGRGGKRRGIGLAMHCQRAGSQSERMEIRVAQDGSVALHAGTLSTGQGDETAFGQMAAEWFGVAHGK